MKGFNVLQPMGWDAFGLPAENAAIKNKVPPAKWTYDNIDVHEAAAQGLGFAIDWSRELATCKPDYYRGTSGCSCACSKKALPTQDPARQLGPGRPDRAGQRTGHRRTRLAHRRAGRKARDPGNGFLRITDYAEELLGDLDELEGWPEQVQTDAGQLDRQEHGVRFAFTHDICR